MGSSTKSNLVNCSTRMWTLNAAPQQENNGDKHCAFLYEEQNFVSDITSVRQRCSQKKSDGP